MPTLSCAAWISERDRGRLDLVVSRFHVYDSDADAVQDAITAFEEVVQILQEYQDRQPAPILRAETDRLFGQIIAWAHAYAPGSASPDDFAAMVRVARETRETVSPLVVTRKAPRRDPKRIAQLIAERERVVLPLLVALDWSLSRWAKESGVDPSVPIGYFEGVSTRRLHRAHLRAALMRVSPLPKTFRLPE
jgi:hypothetical protein